MENNSRPAEGKNILSTRRGAIIFSVSVLIGALLLRLCVPVIIRVMVFMIPPCLLNEVLGIRCPLCGGTRCAAALARGDIKTAWYYNPYVIIVCACLAVLYLRIAVSCFAKRYRPFKPAISAETFSWIVLIVTAVFVILRNLPFYRAVFY